MKIKATIEMGSFDSLKDMIHELNEIIHELESLTQEELERNLSTADYETERMDSILTISESED